MATDRRHRLYLRRGVAHKLAAGEGGLEVHRLPGAPGAATPNPLAAGRSGHPKTKIKIMLHFSKLSDGLIDRCAALVVEFFLSLIIYCGRI